MQTLSDFQNATGKKDVGRYFTERGSKLKKIDSALYEYHKDNSIKTLNVLLSVCLAWLKAKVERRQSTTLSWDQPRGANEPLARRRSAVAALAQEALIELAKYSEGNKAVLPLTYISVERSPGSRRPPTNGVSQRGWMRGISWNATLSYA